MPWGAVAGAVISGYMQSEAADSASGQQQASTREANELSRYMYDQSRADSAPYRNTGNFALSELMRGFGASPGFSLFGDNSSLGGRQQMPNYAPPQQFQGQSQYNMNGGGYTTGPGVIDGEGAGNGGFGGADAGEGLGGAFGLGGDGEGSAFKRTAKTAPMDGLSLGEIGTRQPTVGRDAPLIADPAGANQPPTSPGAPAAAGLNNYSSSASSTPGLEDGYFNRSFSLADFNRDSGYDFRMQEGARGMESSAAARGGLMNGGTLRALERYRQGFASNEYGNAYNRYNNDRGTRFNQLASLAGIGQTSSRDVGQQGMSMAYNNGQNTIGAGNSQAAATMARGSAYGGVVHAGVNAYRQNSGASGSDPYGYGGTNDRSGASTGGAYDWWLRNGSGGD